MNKNKTKLNKLLINNNLNGERLRKLPVIELTLFVQFRSLFRNTAHSNKNCNDIPYLFPAFTFLTTLSHECRPSLFKLNMKTVEYLCHYLSSPIPGVNNISNV